MPYRLAFHPDAAQEFQRLETSTRQQLEQKLSERLTAPKVPSARLSGKLAGCYKIKLKRQGIRLIYKVSDSEVLVLVLAVGRRDESDAFRTASSRRAKAGD